MNENANNKKFNLLKELYELIDSVAVSAVVVIFVFALIFRMFVVNGPSMNPTLLNGDRLIVSNLFYTPKQGDIICFYSDARDSVLVKRIIATEGQTVDIRDDYRVYVDGVELPEDYIGDIDTTERTLELPHTVEKGHVFVMGDNRNDSLDSRYEEIGTVDTHDILGRLVIRLFPKFGTVR